MVHQGVALASVLGGLASAQGLAAAVQVLGVEAAVGVDISSHSRVLQPLTTTRLSCMVSMLLHCLVNHVIPFSYAQRERHNVVLRSLSIAVLTDLWVLYDARVITQGILRLHHQVECFDYNFSLSARTHCLHCQYLKKSGHAVSHSIKLLPAACFPLLYVTEAQQQQLVFLRHTCFFGVISYALLRFAVLHCSVLWQTLLCAYRAWCNSRRNWSMGCSTYPSRSWPQGQPFLAQS